MRDLRQYWQEIRALQASLPEFLWIVDKLGTLVEVTAEIGAKLLHAKSHRAATEEEIQAYLQNRRLVDAESDEKQKEHRGVAVVSLDGQRR